MKKICFIAVLIGICFSVNAQNGNRGPKGTFKLSGKIVDTLSHNPIEYATITIYSQGSEKPVNGTTSNGQGQFSIPDLAPGTYRVVVESIGYATKKLNNVDLTKPSVSLPDFLLVKSRKTLDAVTVTAPRGLVENKIDKMVYNAEKDLTSQGGVATDILKKVPQISVDVDGNVELAGSTSIRFLINGKPSTAFGSSIADVLQAIPASQIKAIEVITNPGAKYDAEGLGGIINIVLKSTQARGVNGNLSLTAGTRMENGSFNFNARKGDFGINAFLSGNYRVPSTTPTQSTRLSTDPIGKTNTSLEQDGSSNFIRHGFQSGIGFDWTIKKKENFTGGVSFNQFGNSNHGLINQTQTTTDLSSPPNLISEIQSLNHSDNGFLFHTVDLNLNYKHKFDKEDQELEIGGEASFGHNHILSDAYQQALPSDSVFYGTQSDNAGTDHEAQIHVDYVQPLKGDVKIGTGAKMSWGDIHSTSLVNSFQTQSQAYGFDSALSNYLHYQQQVAAAYAEISFPLGHGFSTKMGGRYERTDIHSFYSNALQAVNPGYNTFVPSIYFAKKIGDDQTIKLNYSKRIQRPDYRSLNPFINTSDPKNITAGNPNLNPEIGNRVELSYTREFEKTGTLVLTAYYRTSNDDIQPYIVYYPSLKVGDTTYSNVAVSTQENIGLEKDLGMSVFNDFHVNNKFSIRTNLFGFYRWTINKIDSGYNATSFNYRLNINFSYQFSSTLAAEFFGNFSSPRSEVQGKYPSFTSYSFAMRKQIWKKKGSIALTAQNFFGEYVNQRTQLFGPNFTVNSLRQVPFRSIGINFTWKFGKLQFKREREDRGGGEGGGGQEG